MSQDGSRRGTLKGEHAMPTRVVQYYSRIHARSAASPSWSTMSTPPTPPEGEQASLLASWACTLHAWRVPVHSRRRHQLFVLPSLASLRTRGTDLLERSPATATRHKVGCRSRALERASPPPYLPRTYPHNLTTRHIQLLIIHTDSPGVDSSDSLASSSQRETYL
jgi:hypothetical protein